MFWNCSCWPGRTNIDIRCEQSTITALRWYKIAGTTPKPNLRSHPHLSYTHYNKTRHEFLTSSPYKRSIRDKTQRNRINCMRLTIVYCFRKMHFWGSRSHAVYSVPLCFYLGWSAYLKTMSKICISPYYNGYMTGWAAS